MSLSNAKQIDSSIEEEASTRALVPFISAVMLTSGAMIAGGVTLGMALSYEQDIPSSDLNTLAHDSTLERQYRHLLAVSRLILPIAGVGCVLSVILGVTTLRSSTSMTADVSVRQDGASIVFRTIF